MNNVKVSDIIGDGFVNEVDGETRIYINKEVETYYINQLGGLVVVLRDGTVHLYYND